MAERKKRRGTPHIAITGCSLSQQITVPPETVEAVTALADAAAANARAIEMAALVLRNTSSQFSPIITITNPNNG